MSAPVDVLAVLARDSAAAHTSRHGDPEIQEFLGKESQAARAAVAELIEAGKAMQAASDAVAAAREDYLPLIVPMDLQSVLNRALRSEKERFAAALARVKGGAL